MAVSKERKNSQRRADFAVWANGRVHALPPKNGSRILWDNGIVWTRIGDDHWENIEGLPGHPYSSEHVATIGDWSPLSKRDYERMSKRESVDSFTPPDAAERAEIKALLEAKHEREYVRPEGGGDA